MDEIGRCKTCKWWAQWGGLLRKCEHPRMDTRADDTIYTPTGSEILYGPEFGCVHHEEKE